MFKCVGCDRSIPWDGEGMFSYTCGCDARIFYDETTGKMAYPASFAINAAGGGQLPHLDGLVGKSDHTSPVKERLIAELRQLGSIWMEECEQCKRDGTLERQREREKHLALLEAELILRRAEQ